MISNAINLVLPIIIVGVLIFSIKIVGGILERPIKKILKIKSEKQRAEKRKSEFSKIYPLKTDTLPMEHLRRGDQITLSNGRTCVYYSYSMARHSLWHGQKEILLSNEELTSDAVKLENRDGIKWEKQ